MAIWIFISFCLGVLVCATTMIFTKRQFDGELIVDNRKLEKDIYRLELGDNLDKLSEKDYITLKVTYHDI